MTNVNDVDPVMLDVTESCPETVIVYVPVGGLDKGVVVTPPHAVTARPTVARISNPANPRSLRDPRPIKPTRSSPAIAAVRGRGPLPGPPPVFFDEVVAFPASILSGRLPLALIAASVAQSAASASRFNVVVTAAVPLPPPDPSPDEFSLEKVAQRF